MEGIEETGLTAVEEPAPRLNKVLDLRELPVSTSVPGTLRGICFDPSNQFCYFSGETRFIHVLKISTNQIIS